MVRRDSYINQGKTTVMAAKAFFLALSLAAMASLSCEGTDLLNTLETAEEPIRWYSVLSHGTEGQLALEITKDGLYTEPRQALTYRIKVVFPEPLERGAIDETNFDFAGNDGSLFNPVFFVSRDMQDESVAWVVIDGADLKDVARYCIRVRNNDDDVLSERTFGRLEGDVIGDGTVFGLFGGADRIEVQSFLGDTVDALEERRIRCDVICSGTIDASDENSVFLADTHDITGLVFPSF